jgi:hypothetical protein
VGPFSQIWVGVLPQRYSSGLCNIAKGRECSLEIIMAETAFSLESRMTSATMLSRDLEGGAVLLNLGSGTYFGLDKLSIRIWLLFREDGSLRRTFDTMQQDYDVSTETLEHDILRLVMELRAKGLG